MRRNERGKKVVTIRTIDNESVRDVILGSLYATALIYRAASKASSNDPVLEFSGNAWRVKNLCRGFVSAMFRYGFLAEILGCPTVKAQFCLTLVREKTRGGDKRVSLVLIKKEYLEDPGYFAGSDDEWAFEANHHPAKLTLLRRVQEDYLKKETWEEDLFEFLDMELSMPVVPVSAQAPVPEEVLTS